MALKLTSRSLVDWDNDGYFCRGSLPGDPLNISDIPLTKVFADATSYLNLSGVQPVITMNRVTGELGIISTEVDLTLATHNSSGVAWGYSASTTLPVDDNYFDIAASTAYTLMFWLRCSAIAGDLKVAFIDPDVPSTLTSRVLTMVADNVWRQYAYVFTTGVGDTHVAPVMINHTTNPTNRPVFEVAGLMLVAGNYVDAPVAFNTGDVSNGYDDITSTVIDAAWQLGRTSPESLKFVEGTANLTLKNIDKLYSPESTSSPLSGYLLPDRRVLIELYHPTSLDYETMWAGWSSPIQPNLQAGGIVTATLTALQGRFRLDRIKLRSKVGQNQTTDEILDDILKSGWFPAANPYVTVLNRSRLEANSFLVDMDDIRVSETGESTFEYVGEDWVTGETKATQAIEDIMKVERGFLWMRRDGKIVFRPRNYYELNEVVDEALDSATDFMSAAYHYGDQISNQVKVTYYPKTTTADQVLWTNRETITVRRGKSKTLTATFELPEGGKLTATAINGLDAASAPSTIVATAANGVDYSSRTSANIVLGNGEAVVTLTNHSRRTLTFTITLRGTQVLSYGSTSLVISDDASIETHGLYAHPAVSSKNITDPEVAADLGNHIVARYKDPFGTFDKINLALRDDVWLARMLDLEVGSRVTITDTQSGAVARHLIVVGESFKMRPEQLSCTLVLSPVNRPDYWRLGTSVLGTDTRIGY